MSATSRRWAGRCATHDDLAWRYGDGSVSCMFCLVIESSSMDCCWEPLPATWQDEGQPLPDTRTENGSSEWHRKLR